MMFSLDTPVPELVAAAETARAQGLLDAVLEAHLDFIQSKTPAEWNDLRRGDIKHLVEAANAAEL